ncbi:MAG: sorbitol-6-phosphate dehydrogenase [Chloroflexi bacterium]|nr:sorbitol-6-phosphate dehydrogenase [Chloroflexota bacterium]
MRLERKTAVVTGAARGLGEALAERLLREGCSVALLDINAGAVGETAARLADATGGRAFGLGVDVTDEESVQKAMAQAQAEWGRLDLLVSNAGILHSAFLTDFPADRWRQIIDVNLVGYFLCAKAAAPFMIEQGRGAIVQINSKSGKQGSLWNSAYAASKFGGIGLTQSLALDLAPHGIRVNAICPGNLLDSPLWTGQLYEQYAQKLKITPEEVRKRYEDKVPLGRGCQYADVANVLVFLASDEASYMTGQAVNVTGGQEMR